MKPLTFSGTSVRPEADLLQLQPTHLTLRQAELTKERRLYLDTPDQRLQSRDRWLFLQERSGTADSLIRGEGLWADAPVPVGKEPDFLWNLPPQLAEQLRSTIKMRRLLTRLRVELKIQIFRLEDRRQKTVARVHLLQGRVFRRGSRRGQPLSPRTIVIPLKGYPKPFNRMVSMLGTSPEFEEASQSLYQEGLAVLGLTKSGEIALPRITPGMSTFSGLQQILDSLRQIIEENAEGLQEPLDTEYLHRFRVAIRQTRTLLSQARKAFPKRDLQRFSNFFSRLGKTFGVARDLDVYLLKLNGYDSQWPDRFGRHLVTLRSRVEKARVKEQARLNRLLNSQRYRRGMDAWEIFLKAPEPRFQEAERNIEIFAASKIWNCYRKIRKSGKKLSPVGPAEPSIECGYVSRSCAI